MKRPPTEAALPYEQKAIDQNSEKHRAADDCHRQKSTLNIIRFDLRGHLRPPLFEQGGSATGDLITDKSHGSRCDAESVRPKSEGR
jgi:hypothetical protein